MRLGRRTRGLGFLFLKEGKEGGLLPPVRFLLGRGGQRPQALHGRHLILAAAAAGGGLGAKRGHRVEVERGDNWTKAGKIKNSDGQGGLRTPRKMEPA